MLLRLDGTIAVLLSDNEVFGQMGRGLFYFSGTVGTAINKDGNLIRQFCEIRDFILRLRVRMRFGKLSRSPLHLLRLELNADTAANGSRDLPIRGTRIYHRAQQSVTRQSRRSMTHWQSAICCSTRCRVSRLRRFGYSDNRQTKCGNSSLQVRFRNRSPFDMDIHWSCAQSCVASSSC